MSRSPGQWALRHLFTDCVLNMHESERSKPSRWVPFAWMPQYVEALAPHRQTQGYEGHPARRIRLEHQALAHVFQDWDERTSKQLKVRWGGSIERDTKIYMAAVVVDQPQLDKFTGCPGEQKAEIVVILGCIVLYYIVMTCFQLDANVAHALQRSF